ncbi:MAG: hypothetical protein M3256_05390 [Actinomycetota bacterium]|nr:hypothetical protein [Actinomycetota bacterium]
MRTGDGQSPPRADLEGRRRQVGHGQAPHGGIEVVKRRAKRLLGHQGRNLAPTSTLRLS